MRKATLLKTLRDLLNQAAVDERAYESAQPQLSELLQTVLARGAEEESDILAQLLDELDEEAASLLLSEAELQAELVHLGDKKRHSALLIALPVTFLAGDHFRSLAASTDDMLSLAESLLQTEIVDPQARVALLPRLFAHGELAGQSYGARRRLTASLAAQVMAADPVRLDPEVLEGVDASAEGLSPALNDYLQLRYLVGVVVTLQAELQSVFREFDAEEAGEQLHTLENALLAGEADADSLGDAAGSEALLELDESLQWEQGFGERVTEVFGSMRGCQGVTEPADFHEALRFGLEFWREAGLTHQVEIGFHEQEPVQVHAEAFAEENGDFGWHLELRGEDGTSRDLASWLVLPHEDTEESAEMLQGMCGDMGWSLRGLELPASVQ
ncbi:hypothetical protein D3C71_19730 [compost metagenome]